MELLKKRFRKELIVSALFFVVLVWFTEWWKAAWSAALLLILNQIVDYIVGRRRARTRVHESFLRKEAERIEAKRRQGQI